VFIVTSARIRQISLLIVILVSMNACKEKFESHYSSATDAAKAGEFDRGWLPDVLKPDIRNISEWHDVASNEARGRFVLSEEFLNRLRSSCVISADVPRKTSSMPDWFPAAIYRGESSKEGMLIFRCEDFFVAINQQTKNGYFWSKYPSETKTCCDSRH
jgi:hypothetical protein